MADQRFLVVRLGSLGDIVHTLPAVSALREAFPRARIDWVVEHQWRALLERNPDVNEVITLDRSSWSAIRAAIKKLRAARYTFAIDFQGLYKSAALAFFSGARERIGFDQHFAREAAAALFSTRRISPVADHLVDQNLALVESLGARKSTYRFPIEIPAEVNAFMERELAAHGLRDFFILSPGGGWRAKCWPPERYGALHRELARRHAKTELRGIVNFTPNERELAAAVCRTAGTPEPVLLPMDLAQLVAALRRARLVVGGDTGPLHLAVALGTPVVALYGPTDPKRNGPFCQDDIVVRDASAGPASYKRDNTYSAAMLSIKVEQVVAAVERRLGMA